ncbi:MAG TPA: hypothetical protein DC058_01870, partial [Planctomycetaceae bacterium]|nr:hypothetical protein [Planctomycetaceae bacterium]
IYGLYAPGPGSTITLLVPQNAAASSGIYIGNRVLAHQGFSVNAASNTWTAAMFELDVAGSIEVSTQSISLSGADSMLLKGSLISQQGNVTVESKDSLEVRNVVSAGGNILLRATAGDLTLTATSRADAAGTITLDALGTVRLDGPIGFNNAPQALLVTAQTSILASQSTSSVRSAAEVSLTAPVVQFDGLLTTTGRTAATNDYEVRLTATDELRLTGQFTTAGSVLLDTPSDPLIYNFTGIQTGSGSRWKIVSAGNVSLGRITQNGAAATAQGVRLQAVAELLVQTTSGSVTVPTGSQLAVSDDSGRLRLVGTDVQVVGTLLGGASFNGTGQVIWTGRSASVELTGSSLTVGGLGPDTTGTLVTRGALLQATGKLVLNSTGTNSDIEVNALSSLGTMPTAAAALAVASPTPAIELTSATGVRVYGVIDAGGTGADLVTSAGGKVLIDGLLRATDQLSLSTTSTAADSLTLSQLFLKSNSQGQLLDSSDRLIDVNSFLINSDGKWVDANGDPLPDDAQPVRGGAPVRLSGGTLNAGGTVQLTSSGGMNLAGQIGELSVVANQLHSGTAVIQIRAAGQSTVSGRLQASQTADIRSTAGLKLTTAGAILATDLAHLLGGTLQLEGYVGSDDLVILSGVQSIGVTGTAQSGAELRVHSGVSAGWTNTQLLTSSPTATQLAGGTVTVRGSGVLDATDAIRIATGASFSLAADAVVSPNLSSIRTPV